MKELKDTLWRALADNASSPKLRARDLMRGVAAVPARIVAGLTLIARLLLGSFRPASSPG